MAKLLLVDDDVELGTILSDILSAQGYVVEQCVSGEDALQLMTNFRFDLIVLDWGLPGISGEEVCAAFRRSGGQAPVLFLTGRADVQYLETALGAGADDYVVKPFDNRELLARIKTLLKRRTGTFNNVLEVQGLILDAEGRAVKVDDKVIALRSKEIQLLEFLMRNTNRVFTAHQILDAVWQSDADVTTGSVRTWINLLRQKLAEAGKPNLIETVIRSGYTIRS